MAFLLIASFQLMPAMVSIEKTYAQLNSAKDENISYKNVIRDVMNCSNVTEEEKRIFLKNHHVSGVENPDILNLIKRCQP